MTSIILVSLRFPRNSSQLAWSNHLVSLSSSRMDCSAGAVDLARWLRPLMRGSAPIAFMILSVPLLAWRHLLWLTFPLPTCRFSTLLTHPNRWCLFPRSCQCHLHCQIICRQFTGLYLRPCNVRIRNLIITPYCKSDVATVNKSSWVRLLHRN